MSEYKFAQGRVQDGIRKHGTGTVELVSSKEAMTLSSGSASKKDEVSGGFSLIGISALSFLQCCDTGEWVKTVKCSLLLTKDLF